MLRLRSVSISVLDIRDLRMSSLRIDPSTSGATLKLVSGGWSDVFAKSMFTSGPTIRVSTTTSWPSLIISLLTISHGPRRIVISPATVLTEFPAQLGWGYHIQRLHRLLLSIYPAKSPIYSTIDSRVGVSTLDADFFLLVIEIGERGIRKSKARRRALFRPKGTNLFELGSDLE